jgi:3-(3-hydroxy-phenyl)propionate hydroxylase
LNTPDRDPWRGGPAPGMAVPDAPLEMLKGTLTFLSEALGTGFTLLIAGAVPMGLPKDLTVVALGRDGTHRDPDGLLAARFDLSEGAGYLIRPDTHVAARFRIVTPAEVTAAWLLARGVA